MCDLPMPAPTTPTRRGLAMGRVRDKVAEPDGVGFGGQGQFRDAEAVGLRHGSFRAVQDVRYQLAAIGALYVAAIHVLGALLVDQEEVIAARPACNVDILAQLDVA